MLNYSASDDKVDRADLSATLCSTLPFDERRPGQALLLAAAKVCVGR